MSTEKFINVKGFAELQAFLDQLPAKMEANVMRSAMRQGVNVIAREARANAPVGPPSSKNAKVYGGYAGALKKSIVVNSKYSNGQFLATVKAGGSPKQAKGADVYYAKWVEYGVAAHGVKKGSSRKRGKLQDGDLHPGFAAKPFMRPALDSRANDAIQAVGDQVRKRLTKEGLNAPAIEVDDQ